MLFFSSKASCYNIMLFLIDNPENHDKFILACNAHIYVPFQVNIEYFRIFYNLKCKYAFVICPYVYNNDLDF